MPSECKAAIRADYLALVARADRKEINRSCIYNIIEARCEEADRHNCVRNIRYYMPDELLAEQSP